MRNIIVVPAKGDSARLPKKNWMKIGNKTLFELALLRAMNSGLGEVVFATDDDDMLNTVLFPDYKVKIPNEIASKRAVNTCIWVLDWFKSGGMEFDNIIVTLPTSPFATDDNLREAYRKFIESKRRTLGSFTDVNGRPNLWRNSTYSTFFKEGRLVRNSGKVWMDNGAVYISDAETFYRRQEWFEYSVVPYFMNEIEGLDIDTKTDYLIATALYQELKES